MPTYPYTGTLTDIGEAPITDATPRLWVTPGQAAMATGGGVHPDRRKPVPINSSGEFTMWLVPSVETTPPTQYVLRCEWFTTNSAGGEILAGWSEWAFVAAIGGGPINEMAIIPITRIWAGDAPPARPARGLWWYDTSSYPYKWKEWVD